MISGGSSFVLFSRTASNGICVTYAEMNANDAPTAGTPSAATSSDWKSPVQIVCETNCHQLSNDCWPKKPTGNGGQPPPPPAPNVVTSAGGGVARLNNGMVGPF